MHSGNLALPSPQHAHLDPSAVERDVRSAPVAMEARKKPSPRPSERGPEGGQLYSEYCLVVRVFAGWCRVVEFARRANRFLTRIGLRKPGRHVPVQMVHSVRVFGVGLGQFAGENLRLLLEPSRPQILNLSAIL